MFCYDSAEPTSDQIKRLIGRTIISLHQTEDNLQLVTSDGLRCSFYHRQDCWEVVRIKEVIGDLDDLLGTPLVRAEERASSGWDDATGCSSTWTFYEFATIKGSVTVCWLGLSNGHDSESVDLTIFDSRFLPYA